MAKLAVSVALALIACMFVGKEVGESIGRQDIADDCRYGGSFTYKKTGFECRKR